MQKPLSYRTPVGEVKKFLRELHRILSSTNFTLDILPFKKGEDRSDPYTTENTMADLDYDDTDVIDELMKLTTSNYIESIADNRSPLDNPFHVFGTDICCRDVYIKVKIRDCESGKVFCVSFHYARFPLTVFPHK